MTRRRRADMVIIESAWGDRWRGSFINGGEVMDQRTGRFAQAGSYRRFVAEIDAEDAGYLVTTQGPKAGSRRYSYFRDLGEAMDYLRSWARRRFYYYDDQVDDTVCS